jgi:pimeloyl-ACP methyl ester carboxylesterase
MESTLGALGAYDLRPRLARVVAPTLVMIGDGDPFGDALADASVRALAAARPERARLGRCGHFPWIECEPEFRARIEAFLARVGAH